MELKILLRPSEVGEHAQQETKSPKDIISLPSPPADIGLGDRPFRSQSISRLH